MLQAVSNRIEHFAHFQRRYRQDDQIGCGCFGGIQCGPHAKALCNLLASRVFRFTRDNILRLCVNAVHKSIDDHTADCASADQSDLYSTHVVHDTPVLLLMVEQVRPIVNCSSRRLAMPTGVAGFVGMGGTSLSDLFST